MKHPDGTPLRNGFTTGAAATAAAVGAWTAQNGAPPPEQVELLLPDGSFLAIPLERCAPGTATVRKDGGDDPDVTDRAEIHVELRPGSCDDPRAFHEQCGAGRLYLTGGEGVGVVTRPGLAVPPGHFAINPGPRRMLVKNLERAGFGKAPGEELTVVISVPAGKVLAEQTLNPTLGIVGGISILGNSGIVHPYSNAAYAATVALQLRAVAAAGGKAAALVTGNRTAEAVARDCPEFPPEAIIRIGDFIDAALRAAEAARLERIVLGCMTGKLFKYACGDRNTHAANTKLDLTRLEEFGVTLPGVPLEKLHTTGELAAYLTPEEFREIQQRLHRAALRTLSSRHPGIRLEIVLYDDRKEKILS